MAIFASKHLGIWSANTLEYGVQDSTTGNGLQQDNEDFTVPVEDNMV
jgi:hypothetical protein